LEPTGVVIVESRAHTHIPVLRIAVLFAWLIEDRYLEAHFNFTPSLLTEESDSYRGTSVIVASTLGEFVLMDGMDSSFDRMPTTYCG